MTWRGQSWARWRQSKTRAKVSISAGRYHIHIHSNQTSHPRYLVMNLSVLSPFKPIFTSTPLRPTNVRPEVEFEYQEKEVKLTVLILMDVAFLALLIVFASEDGFPGDYVDQFDRERLVSYLVFAGLLMLAVLGCRNRNPIFIVPLTFAKVLYFVVCTCLASYHTYLALNGELEDVDYAWYEVVLITFPYIVFALTTSLLYCEIIVCFFDLRLQMITMEENSTELTGVSVVAPRTDRPSRSFPSSDFDTLTL
ncbi:unnamed protein product [Caenorhabditis auriculariae]|uniref:Uncharacterized protein n=1 Tax=Caenorhabditis auriculariae TaxID=2777116 RepID=A0A8S1H1W0_9PELO|nr:unnamed protein product [Caenorhabditis auriculariae]